MSNIILIFTMAAVLICVAILAGIDAVLTWRGPIQFRRRTVKAKRFCKQARTPTRAHPGDAGLDLYACIPSGDGKVTVRPGEAVMIPTGWGFELPSGFFGGIFARSGLASRYGLRPANCVAVCDSGYRGEYIVPLHNDSSEERTVSHGDRIAQLVVLPHLSVTLKEVPALSATERGEGGFGSSGK